MQPVACYFWHHLLCLRVFSLQTDDDAERSCNANIDNREETGAAAAKAAAPKASHDAMAKVVESQVDHDLGQKKAQRRVAVTARVSLLRSIGQWSIDIRGARTTKCSLCSAEVTWAFVLVS